MVDTIKETLSADRDFQHLSAAEYISEMVDLLHLPAQYPHTSELRNDALFKTMTADLSPLSGRAEKHDHKLMPPIYAMALNKAKLGSTCA